MDGEFTSWVFCKECLRYGTSCKGTKKDYPIWDDALFITECGYVFDHRKAVSNEVEKPI